MSSLVRGGGNRIDLFSISSNAAGTLQHSFVQTIKTDFTLNDDGTWSVPLDQTEDSPALTTFLATYGPAAGTSSSDDESYVYEDKTTEAASTTTDTSKYLVAICYGGVNGSNRKVWQGIVVIQPGAGSYSQEAGKSTKPKMELKSIKAPALTTIAAGKYEATLVTGASGSVATDSYGGVAWYTKA